MNETKGQILEELSAFLAAAEKARNNYYTKAARLASCVALDSAASGKFSEEVRAFIEADTRYTKALVGATSARARLSRFLETDPRGGAL